VCRGMPRRSASRRLGSAASPALASPPDLASGSTHAHRPASRAPRAVSGMFAGMASGQPGWLAWIDHHVASAVGSQGLLASIVLAAALVVVAVGPYLPTRMARAAVVLAIVLAVLIWLAEGMGGLFTGGGTDPNSGPLLALLAVAFWPAAPSPAATAPQGA